ncbi:hypothetical protein CPLU01_02139 [Colletotrichum plurivorum]|uniref:Uncharacterized protein n=1 Tax=Colletotrichum plurivorum TaxID=2175906 RepID=A0A8H6KWB7_9PEZI|nr:hypothetical protein CPLU01_02139 [Colletotrichum plurivorum]
MYLPMEKPPRLSVLQAAKVNMPSRFPVAMRETYQEIFRASLLASTAVGGPLARPPPFLSPSQTAQPGIRDIEQYITQVRSILSHCPQDSSCWQRLLEIYPNLSDALEPGNEAKLLRRYDGEVPPEDRRVPIVQEDLKLMDLALEAIEYCENMALSECLWRLEAAYPSLPDDFHEEIGVVRRKGGVTLRDDPGADGPGDDAPEDDAPEDDDLKDDDSKEDDSKDDDSKDDRKDDDHKDDDPKDNPPKNDPPKNHPPGDDNPASDPPNNDPPKVKPPKIDLPEVAPPVFTPPATVPPDCEPSSGHYRWTLIKRSLKYCPRSPMSFKRCWTLLKKAIPDLPEEFKPRPAARAVTTGSFFVSDVEDVDRQGQA